MEACFKDKDMNRLTYHTVSSWSVMFSVRSTVLSRSKAVPGSQRQRLRLCASSPALGREFPFLPVTVLPLFSEVVSLLCPIGPSHPCSSLGGTFLLLVGGGKVCSDRTPGTQVRSDSKPISQRSLLSQEGCQLHFCKCFMRQNRSRSDISLALFQQEEHLSSTH